MAKNRNKPAAAATDVKTEPAATPEPAAETPAAAPAATDAGAEQAGASGVQADPAAPSDEPEGSAPPAPAEPTVTPDAHAGTIEDGAAETPAGGLTDEQRASLAALADTTQEDLEKQAEEKQPEEPVLDRVLRRLSQTHAEPNVGYCSTSPEVRLSGEMAELNVKLFLAMQAEGVRCHGQGDTLQFLLETLNENLKRAF